MTWESWAIWPPGTIGQHITESTDQHPTEEAAQGVIILLKREGFGGDRKIFPISAGVRSIK